MKKSTSNQLKIGAILSYLSIFLNTVAGFVYTPWMINQIGQGDYGLYTLANSLITFFMVDFGLSSAVSRYVSKYRAEGRQDKVDVFLAAVYRLYLIIDAIIFIALLILYFFIDSIYMSLTPVELEKFKVVYIMAAAFAIVNFPFITFNGILNSYEKFIPLKLADVIYRILLVLLTVLALIQGMGLYALVAVHALTGIIVILFKYIVIKKQLPIKINWKQNEKTVYREIFGFSAWVTVSSLAKRLIFNITPSILGMVSGSSAIAVFGIVTVIEGYVFHVTAAINGMFMPKISRIYEKGNGQKDIMPLMLSVGRFQYALNGLILAGFIILGKSFIELWMGKSYLIAYYGLVLVMLPGLFFNSLQIANTAMVVENKVKLQAMIDVAMGVTNVILSVILSHMFGVIGACISIFVAYMLRDVALLIVHQKVMKFDMPCFIKHCYVRMGIPIILTVAVGFYVNSFISAVSWSSFIIKGVIVFSIYFVFLLLIGLNKNERKKLLKR